MTKSWIVDQTPKSAPSSDKKMLDIELFVYGETLLVGKILHQDESLRGRKEIYKSEGFYVSSSSNPAMSYNTLYIRGSDASRDNTPLHSPFDNPDELEKYVCNVKKALAVINKETKPSREVVEAFKKVL